MWETNFFRETFIVFLSKSVLTDIAAIFALKFRKAPFLKMEIKLLGATMKK